MPLFRFGWDSGGSYFEPSSKYDEIENGRKNGRKKKVLVQIMDLSAMDTETEMTYDDDAT